MNSNDMDALSGPTIDRRTTVKILAAAGMTGLAGCSSGGGEESEDEGDTEAAESGDDIQTGGRLRAGWFTGDVETLDPPFVGVGQHFQIHDNIFNGLVQLEEDLSFTGDLATDWDVEDGGLSYTFELRDDVVFHNGDEFTADDIQYTLRRNFEEEAAQTMSRLSDLEPVDDGGVEVVDDYTVTLNFEEPVSALLAHLTGGPGRAATVINQTAYEEMGAEEYALEPVGTGPFEISEHEPGSSITLDAFDDYFEEDENGTQLPYLDGIDIDLISDPSTLVNGLRGGDLDMINLVPAENVEELEGSQGIEVESALGNTWNGLHLNVQRGEPYSNRDARLGVAKAIDSEALVERAYFGYAEPATGVFTDVPEWISRDAEEKPDDQAYDPEAAEELLEESGMMDGSYSLLSDSEGLRASRVVRDQLREVGLDVEVDQVTTATFWERYQDEADFDMVVAGTVDKPDPEETVWNYYRKPDDGGVWNYEGYENDTVHDLLEEQRRETDEEARAEILWEIEDNLITDVADIYMVHIEDITSYQSSVRNFTFIPSFLRNFTDVWMEG